jgi:hypothetical protein
MDITILCIYTFKKGRRSNQSSAEQLSSSKTIMLTSYKCKSRIPDRALRSLPATGDHRKASPFHRDLLDYKA